MGYCVDKRGTRASTIPKLLCSSYVKLAIITHTEESNTLSKSWKFHVMKQNV